MRTFNTTGPCDPSMHYLLPPLERTPAAMRLVQERCYVAVSGPRQSGKTSLLKALVDDINALGWARAVLLSCEPAGQRQNVSDVGEAERRLLREWFAVLRRDHVEVAWPDPESFGNVTGVGFGYGLGEWAVASDKPLVVVMDEVDTLARVPFVSLLSQIRSGFTRRGRHFPASIVLAGMRNLRDHDIALGGAGNGSPFNIVEFVTLGDFTRDEVVGLYAQHTADTGQRFTDEAVSLVWEQTHGQPWLVNALARTCVTELVTDRSKPVEAVHVEEAVRRLEASNSTHLTSLAHRLTEERVMNVVAPVVVGDAPQASADDERYAVELGLLRRGAFDVLEPSNPIYARALLRQFSEPQRRGIAGWAPTWLVDGHIDLDRLRENFLAFWALHRNMMKDRISYPEAVAHFGLMTYLDRVANGGGRVDREFAVGLGKLDLLLVHGDLKLPIEVKVHRNRSGDPVPEGLAQLDRYCAGLGVNRAWLVVFDQRSTATGERLEPEEVVTAGGCRVLVVRA